MCHLEFHAFVYISRGRHLISILTERSTSLRMDTHMRVDAQLTPKILSDTLYIGRAIICIQ